jgi:DNA-binding IclR family transcriptional regulator
LRPTGVASLPDLTTLAQATDCNLPLDLEQQPAAGTQLSAGGHVVTFTVTDPAGNAAHCAVPVTVVQAPRITQQPASTTNELGSALELPATAGGSAPLAWQWHHGTNALADATNATLTLAPLAFADAGEYWARVRNAAGSTDTQPATVTVVDTTAPLITACAPAPTLAAGPGCQAPLPELTGLVGATDLNLPLTVTQTPPAGTLLDLGETTVTVTVTDAAGNPATCPTTVTVVDQTAPVITLCPPAQELPAGPTCTALVPDLTGALLATDCDPNLTRTQTPPAGTVIGLGDTTVTLTVRDGAANATPCEVTLTVRDATPPAITAGAPPQTLVADAQCQAGVPDFTGALTATDCHGPLTVTQSPPAGAPAGLGQTLVTLTVTDAAGNPATSETTLTVRDETAPAIASCAPAPTLAADATGQATLPDLTGLVQAADCGGPLTVSQAPPAGTRLELGETPVTFTVTDAAGNAAHCAVPVTVVQAPRITQQPASTTNELGSALELPATAGGSAPLAWQWHHGTNALADATNATLTLAPLAFADAGEYWARVRNAAGSTDTQPATVTVVDTTAPLITACAPAPTLAAGPGCQAPLPELTGLVGATDLNLPPDRHPDPPRRHPAGPGRNHRDRHRHRRRRQPRHLPDHRDRGGSNRARHHPVSPGPGTSRRPHLHRPCPRPHRRAPRHRLRPQPHPHPDPARRHRHWVG